MTKSLKLTSTEKVTKKELLKTKVTTTTKNTAASLKSLSKRTTVFNNSESDEDIEKYEVQSVDKTIEKTNEKNWIWYISDSEIAFNTLNFYGSTEKFEPCFEFMPDQRERFCHTCFGKFIALLKIQMSSKLVNHLIMRIGHFNNVENNDKILIEIGGKVISFSQQDFAAIIGLRFKEGYKANEYTVEHPDGVFTKFFGNGSVRKCDHIGLLLEKSKELPDDARTKYLLIYFSANVLLVDSKSVSLDTSYMRMVDNLDRLPMGERCLRLYVLESEDDNYQGKF